MYKSVFQKAQFLTSAAKVNQLPEDLGHEVAFVGRSNAGKSSALNTLTGINNLARTSKTPGRTQLLNVFTLEDPDLRLIDLPGYGFAKVPKGVKDNWMATINHYLTERESLRGLVMLMDIRHPFKPQDLDLLQWCIDTQLPVHILLTKADKLKRGAAQNTLLEARKHMQPYEGFISIQLFSSLKRQGVEDLHEILAAWLDLELTND